MARRNRRSPRHPPGTRAILAALLLGACAAPLAATISLAPSAPGVNPGDSVSIDIVAGGLGASGAPSVGGFNLDLVFDPGFVSFVSTIFGPFLGAGATDLSDFLGPPPPGTVNAAQVAGFLTLPGDLDALQSDTIVLATMSFTVGPAASGSSTLTVGPAGINGLIGPPLADGLGFELAVDSFTGTTLTVPAREASAPGSLALTALALAGLGAIRRRTCART